MIACSTTQDKSPWSPVEPNQTPRRVGGKATMKASQTSPVHPEVTEPLCPQEGHRTNLAFDLDRRRKRARQPDPPQSQDEPIDKRPRVSVANHAAKDKTLGENTGNNSKRLWIDAWVQGATWPKGYFEPDPIMSQPTPKKRSSSNMSYAQSVKQGDNPAAYSPEYERVLEKAGIFMHQHLGQATISDTCKMVCATLLAGRYEGPKHSLFQGNLLGRILARVRSRNEARVLRDITPSLVPSAELLFIRGASHLEHLTDELNAEWVKCIPLAGPRPKPDFAVGLMSSAFTDNEVEKLKTYTAPEKPTLFTGNSYFPFLVCEVKSGENGLNVADRQNSHSASMAVNAIVQLHRSVEDRHQANRGVCRELQQHRAISEADGRLNQATSQAEELHRKILVFSISHDHTTVNIYGHYPWIEGDKVTFHRHLIRSFNLMEQDGRERWTAYRFVRKLYDHFFPLHLARIQSAIAQLPEPRSESFMSMVSTETESELPDSQEMTASASASQDMEFKKPKLTAAALLKKELDRQRRDNEQLRQDNEQLRQEMKQELAQRDEKMKQELAQRDEKIMDLLQQALTKQSAERNRAG
ncbi:MAG: hypothetical protein M1816_003601 [Peltula sp. TS41687]|nr:MAG: hypothetical protein M1816_003601 [Peltula sp. TS41687]